MKILALSLIVLGLLSCSAQKLSDYQDQGPKLDLKEFFNGDLVAYGIVQKRGGKLAQSFKVDIKASWKGDIGTLDEKFVYSDGSKSARVWTLKETESGQYLASAGDVIGQGRGETSGNTFYLEYQLDLEVDGSNYKVNLEDWMYLVDRNVLMARSYMSKWGVDLADITIVMMKKESM